MYKIQLEQFEGPLDLLLFFIKRDELDIYDIPISRITGEFLEYLHLIQQLDLEIAGDFLLVASTLMHIKARMLLPREKDEKGEEIDPRDELVERLLEYKRYKEMAEELGYIESNQKKIRSRGNFGADEVEKPPELETYLRNVGVFDLAKAFRRALDKAKPDPVHQIKRIPVSIDDQIAFVERKLAERERVSFLEAVLEIKERIRLVVTFVAILEMAKMNRVGIDPTENFNDFFLYRIDGVDYDGRNDERASGDEGDTRDDGDVRDELPFED
ncbi:MAG: segregation/condensation protein A [Ignavibacteriales bacterium]|nr:segregation/condensation protein A [Ignavibacteriales bacterium]